MNRLLITGGTGFLGEPAGRPRAVGIVVARALCPAWLAVGITPAATAVRQVSVAAAVAAVRRFVMAPTVVLSGAPSLRPQGRSRISTRADVEPAPRH